MQAAKSDTQLEKPASLSRTERKKQERMARLLQAAADVFSEKGYDKTSLADIAERIDMRGPSLYHYVKTKEDLFIRCANEMLDANFANLEKARDSEGTPLQRLQYMYYVQILGQLDEFYPKYIPLFINVTSTEPRLIAHIAEMRKKHIKYFIDLAEEAVASGELKGEQWRLGLRLAAGSLSALYQWYQPNGELTPEKMADKIATSLMKLLTE